jgi:hypothetical protein
MHAEKETLRSITKTISKLFAQLEEIRAKQAEFEEKAQSLLGRIKAMTEAYEKIAGEPPTIPYPAAIAGKYEKRPVVGPNARIGNAMQSILEEYGPLAASELIPKLRERNVRLSERSPNAVITMTIRQDQAKRFKRLADGIIRLAKEGK